MKKPDPAHRPDPGAAVLVLGLIGVGRPPGAAARPASVRLAERHACRIGPRRDDLTVVRR